MFHEPGHVGDALRQRAGLGARDARGARAVRGRRHRRRRRVRADRRETRRGAAAPRPRPGQRPGQPAQRPPRPDSGGGHRRRPRHRPRPLRRPLAVRHRGPGPHRIRLGALQRHPPRPGPRRDARGRGRPVRPDRHPDPPRRRLLDRRRRHRPAPPRHPPFEIYGRLQSATFVQVHALPWRDGPVRARPVRGQPDQRRDRDATARRDVPGPAGARRRGAGRRPAGLPGRAGRGPAGRDRAPHPGRRPLAGVVLRLPRPGQRPRSARLYRHRPGRTRPGRRGRPRLAGGPGRGRDQAGPHRGRAPAARRAGPAGRGQPGQYGRRVAARARHHLRRGQHLGLRAADSAGRRAAAHPAHPHRRLDRPGHARRDRRGHRRPGPAGAVAGGRRQRPLHPASAMDPGAGAAQRHDRADQQRRLRGPADGTGPHPGRSDRRGASGGEGRTDAGPVPPDPGLHPAQHRPRRPGQPRHHRGRTGPGAAPGLRRARTAPDRGDRPPGVPAPVRRGLVTLT
jgi:hypothetical protein